jgi:hypothetical protein
MILRKRSARNKGLSSIIAAVLMTLLIMLSLNAFLAVVYHSDLYMGSREERNTREWEKAHEKLRIVSLSIDGGKLNATVVNEGAVPIDLVDVYVTDCTVGFPNTHNLYPLSTVVPPASYLRNVGQSLPANLDSLHTYEVRIYTNRGNFAEDTYLPRIPQTEVGPFCFSFDKQSFNYSTSNAGGGVAWEIVASSSYPKHNIIFTLKLTNHGTRAIEISYLSYIMVVQPQDSWVENEYYYHILNNTSTCSSPKAYTDYSQVVPANPNDLEVGVTQIVKFGATKPGVSTLQDFPIPAAAEGSYGNERKYVYTVWIGIFWRWQGSSDYYGIYLPFSGIHVRSTP